MVEGEPPEGAGEEDWAAVDVAAETGELAAKTYLPIGVSPLAAETPPDPCLRLVTAQTWPKTLRECRHNHHLVMPSGDGRGKICPEFKTQRFFKD